MKFMLIIMSAASHSHMGNFIWKFHLPAEISPCSIPYQYDVEKRRREKITQTYFRKKGCVRKNSTLLTRKMVRQIKVSVMDIPFEAYLWGKKKKKSLVNKLLLQFTCGTRRPTIWTCIKHAGLALQGHTVKKCKCVRVSQCRACLHMNKS